MKTFQWDAILFAAIFFFSSSLVSQTVTGSISGVVDDESGAVVPGASVTVTNVDTGIGRSVVTDAAGRYNMPGLIPDHYEVQIQMAGFETSIRKGLQLTVGANLEINVALKVGQVSEKTVVTAEAPLVETLSGTVSGLVDDKAIRDLPLNGRSFDQLISLESSAPVVRLVQYSPLTGAADFHSVNGARGLFNLFLMDGTEMIGAGSFTTLPGGALGKNMGVEAIREFTVLSSNYSATYGKRAGGIINIATRSGTNQIHGSAFEFLRNSALDARNFFDPTPSPPPFKRNQFGASLGGPIRKDRAFFFGTYEGLRDNLGRTTIQTVPDNNVRQGLIPDPQRPGQFTNVGVAPQIKPYLILFPPVNGRNFGDGSAEAIVNPTQLSTQDFYLGRIDHKLSDKDSLFVRYNYTPANQHLESPQVLLFGSFSDTKSHLITVEETRSYATTVNTVRIGFTRAATLSDTRPTTSVDPSLEFLPGAHAVGNISFSTSSSAGAAAAALTAQGSGSSVRRHFALNQFDVADQIFHQHGPHAFQFGMQVQRFQSNGDNGSTKLGNFRFPSLLNFIQAKPDLFGAPSPTGSGDATKAYRQTYIAPYFQDDYKVTRSLTLNMGLRWDFLTVPTEASGNRISNYRPQSLNGLRFLPTNPTLGAPFYKTNWLTFAPRIGFAWDTFGNAKMAVRGGFGVFFDQIQSEYRFFTTGNAPFYSLAQVTNPPFPLGFSGGAGVIPLPAADTMDPNLDVPTRLQYNLGVQRQLTTNTALNIGYVGSHSYHLTRESDANVTMPQILPGGVRFYPANTPRINPNLASSRVISTESTSFYNALQLDLSQRLSHGLRSKVSFTYSKNIDDSSGDGSSLALGTPASTENPDNLRADRGRSAFDLRRNLVANFTYDLSLNSFSGAAGKLLGGWQVGGIATFSDGTPFTVLTGFNRSRDQANITADRPNLRAGASNNPVLGGPDKYFDSSVFVLPDPGFYGNLGRDTVTAPGFSSVDFTLVKVTGITETTKLDFRAEFFNLLNRANFGLPSNIAFNSNGTTRTAAGRISSTTSTSRQIQFGLKLVF